MTAAAALLDSNVVIAALAEEHIHHAASLTLLFERRADGLAVAPHSFAEAYVTLTRVSGPARFDFTPADAFAALERVRAETRLVALTGAQTLDAIRQYAATGGTGPRLYDALIGQVAVAHDIRTIVTWNLRHMAGLFPKLDVVSPLGYLRAHTG